MPPSGAAHTGHWPLPADTFSQLRVKFHKLIFFQSQENTHTSMLWNSAARHVLSWQIKQIEFQSTKRINFHGHISLRILIHCFDSKMMFVMTVGCRQAVMMCLIWDSELIFPPTGFQFRHFVFGQLSQTKAQSSDHKTSSLLTFNSLLVYSKWQKNEKAFCNQLNYSPPGQ